jgi:trigger factor
MALTIEVEEERTRQALRDAARRISRQAKIPGFRPGKAPYNVVARYLGKEALYQEIVDKLGDTIYKEALEQAGIEPFGQATLTDYQTEPLVLKLVVPLRPVVELGDYRQIHLEAEEEAIREKQVNQALSRIQEQNTFWEPVERPAQWGDLAIVDIEGTVRGEAVVENKGRELILKGDSSDPVPGLSDKLLGMTVKEQRELTLTYPEDFEDGDLAGQQAQFKIYLQDLKQQVVPDIDDDLARTVGNYETLEDLKAELRRELQTKADEEFANRALAALVERAEIEFPLMMLEKETDDWLKEFDRGLKRQNLNLENYLAMRKVTEEEFRKQISPQIEERLKRSLALGKLAELEGLDIGSERVVDETLKRLVAIARGELEEEPSAEKTISEEQTESTDQ